jgi:hypothetical protein
MIENRKLNDFLMDLFVISISTLVGSAIGYTMDHWFIGTVLGLLFIPVVTYIFIVITLEVQMNKVLKIFLIIVEFYDKSQGKPCIHHVFTRCKTEELLQFLEILQQTPDVKKMVLFHTEKMDTVDLKNRLTRADVGINKDEYLVKLKDK